MNLHPGNPNPNSSSYCYGNNISLTNPELEVSDYLILDDGFDQDQEDSSSQSMVSSDNHFVGDSSSGSYGATSRNSDMQVISYIYTYTHIPTWFFNPFVSLWKILASSHARFLKFSVLIHFSVKLTVR